MSLPIISLRKASIGYVNSPVLTDVNLDIFPGQQWAIVGVAGSGKTSLLNAIAGNLQLQKGLINRSFTGEDDTVDFQRLIGYVSSRHQFRNLSNTSDFYYQQRYNSSDSDDALLVRQYLCSIDQPSSSNKWTLSAVITLLKLDDLIDKQLIKLSNGETKRLMIAAALLKNPGILLLDNPLTGLDVETRSMFNDIIEQIMQSGITIVMATGHHEIPDVVTHVAALASGTLTPYTRGEFDIAQVQYGSLTNDNFDVKDLIDGYQVPAYKQVVAMRNVSVRYGERTILANINWQIKQGERWALVGPNGAGKSTLLSLINGDNPQAYANDIILFDKKRGTGESIWDIKKRIGFVSPELYQYFPSDISCLHAVESGYDDTIGLFRPSSKARSAQALKWMQALGLGQFEKQLLKKIPAGAQRLCLLARAMIKCPVLLILDEPCQGMDDLQIAQFKALINNLCSNTNVTLIYVTHYQEHIPDSVNKVLRLESGCAIN